MVGGLFDKVWRHRNDLPDFGGDLKFLVTWCEWGFVLVVGGLFDKVWRHRDDLPDFGGDLKFLVTWCEWGFVLCRTAQHL